MEACWAGAMVRIRHLFNVIVRPSEISPWARENLNLRRLANWFERVEHTSEWTLGMFEEIRALLVDR